jgi:FkbM family methyltransferase
MGLGETVRGKWYASRSLAQFARHFRNWPEVWAAYRAGRPLPPLVFRGGLALHHGDGDDPIFLFREIFVSRCYTRDGFYQPQPDHTVLDLGANIGAFALFLQSRAPGVHVHCFEPADETRARLARNVEANGLGGSVTVYPFAVSDRAGFVSLGTAEHTIRRSIVGASATEAPAAPGGESVETVSLAEAIARTGAATIDLLKVDIEGAEVEAVGGAPASAWSPVRRVILEYHDNLRPGCSALVATRLREAGFGRVEVLPDPDVEGLGFVRAGRG